MKKPTKLEAHIAKERFLKEYTKKHCQLQKACDSVGISVQTYYNWYKGDPLFKEAIDTIREGIVDIAEQALLELNRERNPQTVIFTLKTLGKNRGYQEQTKLDVNVNGEIVNKISIEIVNPNQLEGQSNKEIEDGTQS